MNRELQFCRSSDTVHNAPAFHEMDDRVDVLLRQEIQRIRQLACNELLILECGDPNTAAADRFERSRRLNYLLQRDLLASALGGCILDNKAARDAFFKEMPNYKLVNLQFAGRPMQTRRLRAFTALAILSINVGMVIYILTFAFQQPEQRQKAWIYSFLLFLMLDVLFISTLEVLLLHVALPGIISSSMEVVHTLVSQLVEKFHDRVKDELSLRGSSSVLSRPPPSLSSALGVRNSKGLRLITLNEDNDREGEEVVNIAELFFSSFRVAQYFEMSSGSSANCSFDVKFILSYASSLPPGRGTAGNHFAPSLLRPINTALDGSVPKIKIDKRDASQDAVILPNDVPYESIYSRKFLSIFALLTVKWFLTWPYLLQDMVTHFLLMLIVGALLLLHWTLFKVSLVVFFVPSMAVLFFALVHYLPSWWSKYKNVVRIFPTPEVDHYSLHHEDEFVVSDVSNKKRKKKKPSGGWMTSTGQLSEKNIPPHERTSSLFDLHSDSPEKLNIVDIADEDDVLSFDLADFMHSQDSGSMTPNVYRGSFIRSGPTSSVDQFTEEKYSEIDQNSLVRSGSLRSLTGSESSTAAVVNHVVSPSRNWIDRSESLDNVMGSSVTGSQVSTSSTAGAVVNAGSVSAATPNTAGTPLSSSPNRNWIDRYAGSFKGGTSSKKRNKKNAKKFFDEQEHTVVFDSDSEHQFVVHSRQDREAPSSSSAAPAPAPPSGSAKIALDDIE